jgi:hypothetical protein
MKYCRTLGCLVLIYITRATTNKCPSCGEVGNEVEPMLQITLEEK